MTTGLPTRFDHTTHRTRLTYLLAASHSGSTLLAFLLAQHPDVATVGEIKATSLGDPEAYRCSCQTLIRDCPFWRSVARDMANRGISFDVCNAGTDLHAGTNPYTRWLIRPLHRGPILEWIRDTALAVSPRWRSNFPRIQAVNAALAEVVCARLKRPVLVDSSKIGLRLKYLLRNPALDIRVIWLVRDGRGVALTHTDPAQFADANNPLLRGGGTGTGRESERLSIAAAAHEWRRSNEEAQTIVQRLDPSRWIRVRYEDLCTDPGTVLGRLFGFVGVDPDARLTPFRSAEHHVIGNGMRLDLSGDVRLDDRWKTALGAADLRAFDAVAGPLNRQLGYE